MNLYHSFMRIYISYWIFGKCEECKYNIPEMCEYLPNKTHVIESLTNSCRFLSIVQNLYLFNKDGYFCMRNVLLSRLYES